MRLSEFIREELLKRGWSGTDLGSMLGCSHRSTISKLVNGKQLPSIKQVTLLAEIFNVSINEVLTMRWEDELAGMQEDSVDEEKLRRVIKLYKTTPIPQMLKYKWASISDRTNPDELIKVFGPMEEEFQQLSGRAHKTDAGQFALSDIQKAWIYEVRTVARKLSVSSYSENALRSALPALRQIMVSGTGLERTFAILSQVGVRLVFVECKNSKIDGVCTWLDALSPVIGMTLRFDRYDNFWFILRHELEHVLQGPSCTPILDDDLLSQEVDKLLGYERSANIAAREFCVPEELTFQCIEESKGFLTDLGVHCFAERHELSPCVLAGQIRHKLNRYNILTKLMTPIRASLIECAPMVEGWGRCAV